MASRTERALTIGRLARAARVNVETIRYYQRRGLPGTPRKPPGGVRHYPQEALARLRFIKRAQQLGFSLRDIRELLVLGDHACADTRPWLSTGSPISKRACLTSPGCAARSRS